MKKKEFVEYTIHFHLKNGKTITYKKIIDSFIFFKNKWKNDAECTIGPKELSNNLFLWKNTMWKEETLSIESIVCIKAISISVNYVKNEKEWMEIYVYDREMENYIKYQQGEKDPLCWYDNLKFHSDTQFVDLYPLPIESTKETVIKDYLYDGNVNQLDPKKCVIPETVQYIEKGCFDSFNTIESVYISKNIEYIDAYAFSRCYWLKEIHSDNDRFLVKNNRLYDRKREIYLTYEEKNAKLFLSVNDSNILSGLTSLEEEFNFKIGKGNDQLLELYCQFEKNNGKVHSSYLFKELLSKLKKKCVIALEVHEPNDFQQVAYYFFDGNQQYAGIKDHWKEESVLNIRDWMKSLGITYSKKCTLNLSKFQSPIFDFTRTQKKEKIRENKRIEYVQGYYQNDYSIGEVISQTSLIEDSAFKNCIFLKKADLQTCETIEESAFENCTNLEAVIFSNKLKYIHAGAFKGCTSLKRIRFETGLLEIGPGAFHGCTQLKEVLFSSSIVRIKEKAFSMCKSLLELKLPNLKVIHSKCFYGCSDLIKVELPDCLETIEHEAFAGCEKLEQVIASTNNSCSQIVMGAFKDTLFYKNTRMSAKPQEIYIGKYLWFSNVKQLVIKSGTLGLDRYSIVNVEELTIPASLKVLDQSICINQNSLKKLTFESGVSTILKDIYGGAFENCLNLESVYWPVSLHLVHPDTFKGCSCTIYGKEGSYAQIFAQKNQLSFKEV